MSKSALELFREKYVPKKIEKIISLKELEDWYRDCPSELEPAIEARYVELLRTVTSLEELERRYAECPGRLQCKFFIN